MTKRENLLARLRGEPHAEVPCEVYLCPSLEAEYARRTGGSLPYEDYFGMPRRSITPIAVRNWDEKRYLRYHANLKPGTTIDEEGAAHEPGSEAAKHMTHQVSPLAGRAWEEVETYPFPEFSADNERQKADVRAFHARGLAACANLQMTIWETSWRVRGMEDLLVDMMQEEHAASFLLDKITDNAVQRARMYVEAGADILFLGDDVGMQRTVMMSDGMYTKWLKPRLKRVIEAARDVRADIMIWYHSCGHVTPFIPHFIEAGIDVLHPVQPECMDFAELYALYGDKIGFNGTIGTQTVMPFGTPQEVRDTVHRNLAIAKNGRLFPSPTHLLEPEVPWENIVAYVEACREAKV